MLRKGQSINTSGVLSRRQRPERQPSPIGGQAPGVLSWGGLTCDSGCPRVPKAKVMNIESRGGQATREGDSEGKVPQRRKHMKYASGRKHAGEKPG
jgi:hypothetical protein